MMSRHAYNRSMTDHRISPEDKATIVRRLAEDASTRQAIQGTAVRSNNTAARLANSEAHVIAQK